MDALHTTPFSVTRKVSGDTVAFALSGQLDSTNCDAVFAPIYSAADDSAVSSILIDCRNLEYLNSKSIGYAVDLNLRCEAAGKRLAFFGAADAARDALEVSGATEFLRLFPNEAEALSESKSVPNA